MKLPRLTTRRWMLIVAILAVLIAATTELKRRRARFQWLAEYHLENSGPLWRATYQGAQSKRPWTGQWHLELSRKYDRAALAPWFPVAPDPPPPRRGDEYISSQ